MNTPWWMYFLRRYPTLWAIVTLVTFILELAKHAKHEIKKRSPELREALEILTPKPNTPKPIPRWRQLVNKGLAIIKRKVDMVNMEPDSGWDCSTCDTHNKDGDALCVNCTTMKDPSDYLTHGDVISLLIANTIRKSVRLQVVVTVLVFLLLLWLGWIIDTYIWTPGIFIPLTLLGAYLLVNSPRGHFMRGFADPNKILEDKQKKAEQEAQKAREAAQRAQQQAGPQGAPRVVLHPAPPSPGTDPNGGATTSQL